MHHFHKLHIFRTKSDFKCQKGAHGVQNQGFKSIELLEGDGHSASFFLIPFFSSLSCRAERMSQIYDGSRGWTKVFLYSWSFM